MSRKIDVQQMIDDYRKKREAPDPSPPDIVTTCGHEGDGWMYFQVDERTLCTDCFLNEFPTPERTAPGRYQYILPFLGGDQ